MAKSGPLIRWSEPPIPASKCRHCREEIAAGAKVCPECGHYQNRFRHWATQALGQVAAVAVIVSAGFYMCDKVTSARAQPDLAITHFSELDGISITNRGSDSVFLLRVKSDIDPRPLVLQHPLYNAPRPTSVRMPQGIDIGETIQPGATLYRKLEPRVDYTAGNAQGSPLTPEAMQQLWGGQPYEILYLAPTDDQRQNPYLIPAHMTLEFVWRGENRTIEKPIGAFLYKLKARRPPPDSR